MIVNKAIQLVEQGKIDTALNNISKNFDKSSYVYLFFNGWVNQLKGNHEKAILSFEESLLANPNNVDTLFGLAISYEALNQLNTAIECCEQARIISPENFKVLFVLIGLYRKIGVPLVKILNEYIELLSSLIENIEENKVLIIDTLISIGSCYLDMKDYKNAEFYLTKSLNFDEYNILAHRNLSSVYASLGKIEQAIESCKIAQLSTDIETVVNSTYQEGMLQLLLENYSRGWQAHEFRLKSIEYKRKDIIKFPQPSLSSINKNDSILIFQEQGIGDLLHFSRYIPMLREICNNIDLAIQPNHYIPITEEVPSIKTFLELNYSKYLNNLYVGSRDLDIDKYTHRISIMSLPYLFKTRKDTIPTEPCFKTNTEFNNKYDVGIFWQGSTHFYNDKNRSIDSKLINSFCTDNEEFTFASLQLENFDNITSPNLSQGMDINSLEKTLALVNSCNLVITVDSMVAHLAAGAGKETWILLPFSPDWRWGMQSSTTKWYSAARLFRQKELNNWQRVLDEVTHELKLRKK